MILLLEFDAKQPSRPLFLTRRFVGEQSFGPYGEQMAGTFGGKTLPSGYRPLTGYTGHLNEDLTGLIYMRGRYYSPLWHRFINSDQGVDPYSINQYAYVNDRPFMATDPSGMAVWCLFLDTTVTHYDSDGNKINSYTTRIPISCWEDSPKGGGDNGGGGGNSIDARDPLCDKLGNLGISNANFNQMKEDMGKALVNQSQPYTPGAIFQEYGHSFFAGEHYPGYPSTNNRDFWFGENSWTGTLVNSSILLPYNSNNPLGYSFHTHHNIPGWYGVTLDGGRISGLVPWQLSGGDLKRAGDLPGMNHFMGWDGGLVRYDASGIIDNLAGSGWWTIIPCEGILR